MESGDSDGTRTDATTFTNVRIAIIDVHRADICSEKVKVFVKRLQAEWLATSEQEYISASCLTLTRKN